MSAPRGGIDFSFGALVDAALAEDIRSGDVTTRAVVDGPASGEARLTAREQLVVCGVPVAALCFRRLDPDMEFVAHAAEGDEVEGGAVIATLRGDVASMLAAERTALNFLQRTCGVATATRRVVRAVAGTGAAVLDTRKTAPGLRVLDKYAVRTGGGVNHRFALDDMILVKDNHVRAAGSVTAALERALAAAGHALRVELEVDSLEQLSEILASERLPDAVLLDNFSVADVRRGVELVAGRMAVEVSGGITEENAQEFAAAGPDALSMGALTHSVRAADIGLDFS